MKVQLVKAVVTLCANCGNEVEGVIENDELHIWPCEFCKQLEYDRGFDDGHGEARGAY